MGHLAASNPHEAQIQSIGSSIVAQRANIVDRRGRILATNLDTHSLYAETAHLTDPRRAADGLAKIFPDLKADKLYKEFTGKRKFLWIKNVLVRKLIKRYTIWAILDYALVREKCDFIQMVN